LPEVRWEVLPKADQKHAAGMRFLTMTDADGFSKSTPEN